MPAKWTIQDSKERMVGESPCYQVALRKEDGTTHFHIMPTTALEWRAAEYGIDPTDVDTLLEIILHEPHMARTDDTEDAPQRYADSGPTLWEADSTTAARDAHLARVKACPVQVQVRGHAGLAAIRAAHRPDLGRIRAMREGVDTTRWMKKYGDLPAKPLDRLEAHRA